jgi:hypothetical protein
MQQVKRAWRVAAVLDWEFALSASPLTDVGHFLLHECASRPLAEPHFSEWYLHYQKSLDVLVELQARNALGSLKKNAITEIEKKIADCDAAISKFQNL